VLIRRIYSTLFWAFVLITSVVLFPVAVLIWAVTAPFDRRKVVLHRFTCWWASLYTWCNPLWQVEIRGRERIDPDETYVMVANHLSLTDIFVLFRLFTHFTWVSKSGNFRVPFIGWNMRLNDYIELRRGDADSVRQMMDACLRTLEDGSSIMMFPEGTRSEDGTLQPFKRGSFELALRTRSPILPIVIEGTHEALPKRGYLLQGRQEMRMTVLEPIPPSAWGTEDPQELASEVRAVFAAHLGTSTS
jgi:1-acyl-sn-glycerol-3-phosphate acyltransferase